MPTINNIQKPALRKFAEDLLKSKENDPSAKIDEKQLDELLSIVGDRFLLTSSDSLRSRFAAGTLSLDEKIAIFEGIRERANLSIKGMPKELENLFISSLNLSGDKLIDASAQRQQRIQSKLKELTEEPETA